MALDVDSLLLRLLSQGPSNIPAHSGVTQHPDKETDQNSAILTINGTRYNLIDSTVDLLFQQAETSLQAARVILTVRKAVGDGGYDDDHNNTKATLPETQMEEQPTIELAAHTFAHPQGPTPTSRTITTIIDADALRAAQPTPALRAPVIPTTPGPVPGAPTAAAGRTLRDTYHAYIAAINGGAAAMAARLPGFCHAVVTHNGRALALREYQSLMQGAQAAIPDIVFRVADLIADEDGQRVAARLEFTGTPVTAWAGVEPSGKGVSFSEQAFYWFDEGRIRSVVSLVDMEAYRRQMRA